MGDGFVALKKVEEGKSTFLECMDALLNAQRSYFENTPTEALLEFGIGISKGSAISRFQGNAVRMSCDHTSSKINEAARTESLTKNFQCVCLVHESCFEEEFEFNRRFVGKAQTKGSQEPFKVYQYLDFEFANWFSKDYTQLFEKAVHAFCSEDYSIAKEKFDQCARLKPEDKVARVYQEWLDKNSAQTLKANNGCLVYVV